MNGVCVEGRQHGDVVSAIKAGGDEAKLLVVDKETDEFFKKCKVIPSQEHLHGELGRAAQAPRSGVRAGALASTVSHGTGGRRCRLGERVRERTPALTSGL